MQQQLQDTKNGDTADFERDPNQGSLTVNDLSSAKNVPKEKRFLLTELKTIKEQLYQKLMLFKSRSQGQRSSQQYVITAAESGQFDILDHFSVEDTLRKEIDHFFIMTQVLNTIVLKGDETYRTMQELAKLTNDQD